MSVKILSSLMDSSIASLHCSVYAKELLEKVLRAASDTEILSFFCFICDIPAPPGHTSHKAVTTGHFKSLHPHLHIACGDPLPSLKVVHTSDEQAVDGMERTGQCIITLLKSGLNSEGLIGIFFVECLHHLHTTISDSRDTDKPILAPSSSPSSSVLLACEDVLPLTSGEVARGSTLLHTTATLCKYASDEVLSQCHLPSLLAACGAIVNCHAQILERRDGRGGIRVALMEMPAYGETVMGGSLSLSIVLGLLSAVMLGVRKVSYDCMSMSTSKLVSALDSTLTA